MLTQGQINGIQLFEQERKERIQRILALWELKSKKKTALVTEGRIKNISIT